jgi:hypothetical protein
MDKLLLICLLVILALPALCVNNMEMMFMLEGDQEYGDFGASLAALDFNGDGYDDLAVLQRGWLPDSVTVPTPNSRGFGRLLFYYGGYPFNNIPDFIIEGTHHVQFTPAWITNLGDVNGDGFEDLGAQGFSGLVNDSTWLAGPPCYYVYYGGSNPSTQPGYYRVFDEPHPTGAEIDALGDVNGDGYADIGYVFRTNHSYIPLSRYGIVLGGSTALTEIVLRQVDSFDLVTIQGSGDVNNDGYADYTVTRKDWQGNGNNISSNTLIYGNATLAVTDSLVMLSDYPSPIVWRTRAVGDVNGDGIDDVAGRIISSIDIWYGGTDMTAQNDVSLLPAWAGYPSNDRGLVWGDLNNDGYDDVIGAAPTFSGYSGAIRLWMGGANMNGMMDLYMDETTFDMQYGTGLTAGDFNHDGCCDIAVSAPHSPEYDFYPGRVYVYSGNTELADTTVGAADDNTPVPDTWSFCVVPNPVHDLHSWKLLLTGTAYRDYHDLSVTIYNAKGQRVGSQQLQAETGSTKEFDLPNLHLPAGIYEASVYQGKTLLKTNKFTVLSGAGK